MGNCHTDDSYNGLQVMVKPEEALPGREREMIVAKTHAMNGNTTQEPFPDNMEYAMFGTGCFWGGERRFFNANGVFSTQVGSSQGYTKNPTYQELATGYTGHTEVIRVIYDPEKISYEELLKIFWESHDPTQGMRQGIYRGTSYRSGIYYYNDQQKELAETTRDVFQKVLTEKGFGKITTEILPAAHFYYAEDFHQQHLHKNPKAFCGNSKTGACLPGLLESTSKSQDNLL